MTHGQWIVLFLAAVQLVCVLVQLRVAVVYRIRDIVIDINDYRAPPELQLVNLMPSYEAMVFNPKYWLLWRLNHWRAWMIRRAVREWKL